MTKELLIKFLNNQCTPAELDEVVRWAKEAASGEECRNWEFDRWNSFREDDNLGDDEKFGLLFDKIQQKINSRNEEPAGRRKSGLVIFTAWLTRAAAILLIPVLAYLIYTLREKETLSVKYTSLAVDSLEIVAPVGSRTVIHLSDGSEVHLNYGSRLKYPQVFTGTTREVTLTGEGYFNVFHDPEKPFIVNTTKMKVKALGTSFNVRAYQGDDFIETTLVNGSVVLERVAPNRKSTAFNNLVPMQHASYNTNTGQVTVTKGKIEKYIAWKDGKLVFEDTPIVQVAERLSQMFNVDIEVSEAVRDYYYTVTFVDEQLFQILDLISMATPVSYKVFPRKKLPDNTFTKQKIVLSKRKV